MTDDAPQDRPMGLGVFARRNRETPTGPAAAIAAAGSGLWIVIVGIAYAVSSPDAAGRLNGLLLLAVLVVPIGMIWAVVLITVSANTMRRESERLESAIDAMRQAFISQQQAANAGLRPSMEKKLDELVAAQRQTEARIATFASRRDAQDIVPSADRKAAFIAPSPDAAAAEEQPALALGTPAEELRKPVSVADFIQAMNFPDNAEDKDGFRALRRALDDHDMSKLIRAAQDVLTLLSQDGIYMDDLNPDRAKPEIWRRFADGERGRTIAALGGVRDRSCLALTAGRMRQDTIFRDSAHHFLRQFDKTFAAFAAHASDTEVAALAETRTARAFMLLGRVTGIFD